MKIYEQQAYRRYDIDVVDETTGIVAATYGVAIKSPLRSKHHHSFWSAKALQWVTDRWAGVRIEQVAEELNLTESQVSEVLDEFGVSPIKGFALELHEVGVEPIPMGLDGHQTASHVWRKA